MGLQQRSSSLAKSLVQDVLPETGTSTVIIYSSTAFYGIQQSIWCFFCKVNSQMVEKVWSFAATPCNMHLAKVCSCVCCCIFGAGLTSQTLIFGKFAVVLCRWRSLFKEALVFFFVPLKVLEIFGHRNRHMFLKHQVSAQHLASGQLIAGGSEMGAILVDLWWVHKLQHTVFAFHVAQIVNVNFLF